MSAADKLLAFVEKVGASLSIQRVPSGDWLVSMEWGSEAPDSPMIGAASYGAGDTLADAIQQVVEEVRA